MGKRCAISLYALHSNATLMEQFEMSADSTAKIDHAIGLVSIP
jgi:hypothetical protein